MRERILTVIKTHGTFNGNVMGADTYVIFEDDFINALLKLFEENNNNKCVCCGEVIPEGRQVCYHCELNVEKLQ